MLGLCNVICPSNFSDIFIHEAKILTRSDIGKNSVCNHRGEIVNARTLIHQTSA